jgi:membrane protein
MAAGMSFFALLSLIPIMILVVSFLSYLFGSSEKIQQFVSKLLSENFPGSVEEILEQIEIIVTSPKRALANWLSFLGLMWTGMRFFGMLHRVLNNVWAGASHRKFFWSRFVEFITLISAGLLFWAFFAFYSLTATIVKLDITLGGTTLIELHRFWLALGFIIPSVASAIILFLVYLLVPNVSVSPRAALIGATFATFLLQLVRLVFNLIVLEVDTFGRVYGPLAGVIMFMSWLYLSMIILLLGAELGSEF